MVTGRFHIIVDVGGVENKILNDEAGLKAFIPDLVKAIGMNIIYGPAIVAGIPENPGLSGFAIIDFSHVSIHTFTDHGEALVDIFSCKAYEPEKAIEETLKYFQIPREQARIQTVNWG